MNSNDAAETGGLDGAGDDSDAFVAEIRGWTGRSLGAAPKLLLVFETRLVITRGSRLEAAGSAGTGAGVVLDLLTDLVLRLLRVFGRRRNQQTIVDSKAASPADYARAHPDSAVFAKDTITSVRLSRQRTKVGDKYFVLTVGHGADTETRFNISPQRNPSLRTSSQLDALFVSVFGDRFTNDAVETPRATLNRHTYRALVLATGLGFAITAVACFRPWMSARYVPIGAAVGESPYTVTSTVIDLGPTVLISLGIAVVLFTIGRIANPRINWTLRLSVIVTAVVAIELLREALLMADDARQASNHTVHVSASPAAGLYLAVVGTAIAAATQAILLYRTNQVP